MRRFETNVEFLRRNPNNFHRCAENLRLVQLNHFRRLKVLEQEGQITAEAREEIWEDIIVPAMTEIKYRYKLLRRIPDEENS